MTLEQNIKGICSKFGLDFNEFLKDFEVDHVMEMSLFDLEAICEEYEIDLHTLLFKAVFLESSLKEKLEKIKLLILDVDGVMTDGGMTFTAKGDELKRFNTKDGMGILKLRNTEIEMGIISSGFSSDIVEKRAKMLDIENCYVGREAKMSILQSWIIEKGLNLEQVAMIGDDINDREVMIGVGLAVCPADAVDEIKSISHIVLKNKGGDGCVREFIDNYLQIG
ncbi:MAG: 3-deoxy-D-manno-octulosonate 8-phosphate phosphatase [Cryomorphaceae bacterium]|nr:3-deoxy-D-manno-octulosonate 8-phosphate phosphatase [Cryomorphaceae bacterium]